jgi:hypothetical protein
MFQMSVSQMLPALVQLQAILAKASAFATDKKLDAGVLENARLAPDMFQLIRQVILTADFAKNGCARLAGLENSMPKFPDIETNFPELQERLAKTIEYLKSLRADQFAGAEMRKVVVPLRTRTLEMSGLDFLQRWTLPNFYFHFTTAYNILRHNGVALGKADFLGPT